MNIAAFIEEQLNTWETARHNYAALSQVKTKELKVKGVTYKAQFNPARITSSAARVDDRSIRERPCFLCPAHRPLEQRSIPFEGHYDILLNPFPIFPRHLTIVECRHMPQRIIPRLNDMLRLAEAMPNYTLFYNGPRCGASAPDHAHFQAVGRGFMPIEQEWEKQRGEEVTVYGKAGLWLMNDTPRTTLAIESESEADAVTLFHAICRSLEKPQGEEEPMLNLLVWHEAGQWTLILFPRSCHRPACYYAPADNRMLCSPASVDLGGVFVLPREEDFRRITADDVARILGEVCLPIRDIPSLRQQIHTLLP